MDAPYGDIFITGPSASLPTVNSSRGEWNGGKRESRINEERDSEFGDFHPMDRELSSTSASPLASSSWRYLQLKNLK
ncbi:hypothetical protein ACLOJK_002553 [Asimina triloba]